MRGRSRFRRFAKWATLVASTPLLALTLCDTDRWGSWRTHRWFAGVGLTSGHVFCYWGRETADPSEFRQSELWPLAHAISLYRATEERASARWWPAFHRYSSSGVISVPAAMPLALLVVITALLWWRDRRIPPGQCQKCGYDLTGNLSGVCPECGQKVPAIRHSEETK